MADDDGLAHQFEVDSREDLPTTLRCGDIVKVYEHDHPGTTYHACVSDQGDLEECEVTEMFGSQTVLLPLGCGLDVLSFPLNFWTNTDIERVVEVPTSVTLNLDAKKARKEGDRWVIEAGPLRFEGPATGSAREWIKSVQSTRRFSADSRTGSLSVYTHWWHRT